MGNSEMVFETPFLVDLLCDLFAGHIKYQRGTETIKNAKGKEIKRALGKASGKQGKKWKSPSAIKGLDCSGFVQYVIHESTTHYYKIPQGSINQLNWLEEEGFHNYGKDAYENEAIKKDDTVRIAFRKRKSGNPVGHVWLVINGRTYESTPKKDETSNLKNKKIGPKSFKYSVRTDEVDHFYLLGRAPRFGWILHNKFWNVC